MGYSNNQIKNIVYVIKEIANQDTQKKVKSMVELLQNIGIDVYKSKMNSEKVSGYVAKSEKSNRPKIVVNSDDSNFRQRFTMAHELGHLILHFKWLPHSTMDEEQGANIAYRKDIESYSLSQKSEEVEANVFAAELLMPENEFLKLMDKADDEELSDYFGVSLSAIAVRKKSMKKIKEQSF